ncbi:hypothetical protein [Larkinella soli]|uniref:hypothetical protein n=1 Tax=Larkinella soli TaxID=1770527 RepID=UPI000FFC3814|nr:hypothetical protein [Larkinella soli]
MLIISGADFLKLGIKTRYDVVVNATLEGNQAFLFHQKLNVSKAVSELLADDEVGPTVFRQLRIMILESSPSL